ncbi:uncharacterized protein LOC135351276 isoform X2 [Halichondria panicea]|uniref:uncharacterized protein LOC135351276 isoform X2 n=1 Tax=Halichondria panicea TaxID=6063 RepID=UPI00312BC4F4
MARDVSKKSKKGPVAGYGPKYPGFGLPRVRNDLGAESPNWRDHSKELQKKTAEPLSCSQFLSNGWVEYEVEKSEMKTIGGDSVEIIGQDLLSEDQDYLINADKWIELLKQHTASD